jgi:hypothetical protein
MSELNNQQYINIAIYILPDKIRHGKINKENNDILQSVAEILKKCLFQSQLMLHHAQNSTENVLQQT